MVADQGMTDDCMRPSATQRATSAASYWKCPGTRASHTTGPPPAPSPAPSGPTRARTPQEARP